MPPLRESATPAASRPAVPIALAFLSGVALARALPGSSGPVLAVVAALAGLGSAAVARADRRTGLAPVLLLLAAVFALGAARRLDAEADETARTGTLDLPPGGSQAMLKARVLREPETRFGRTEVEVEIESGCIDDERPAPAGILVLARIPRVERRRAGDLLPGRRVELAGRLELPPELRFPFGHDRAAQLRRRGEVAVLDVETAWRLEGASTGPATLVARAGRRARRAIQDAGLPRDVEAVIRAMVLGDRGSLSSSAHDAFVATGTVHLLVIAGLHIAILTALLQALARALPLRERARALLVALGLLVYLGLAGPRPGAVRATVGALVFVVAGASGRGGDAWNRLAVSLVAMLAIDPLCVDEAGFQLSFGTVAGLLALARPFERALVGPRPDRRFEVEATRAERARAWLSRSLRRDTAASLAAFVAHAPLVLVAFGQVAPVVVLANLPAIPLATLCLGSGVAGAALGSVHELLGRPFLFLAGISARALIAIVDLLARVPLATLDLARPSAAATALALGTAALGRSLSARGHKRAGRAVFAASVFFWLAAALPSLRPEPELELVPAGPATPRAGPGTAPPRLVVLPGRGGLAALVILADGRSIRVGTGGGHTVERSLSRIARDAGGPLAPSLSVDLGEEAPGASPREVTGLPEGIRIFALGEPGTARAVLVEANGRSALVLDDPGARELARLLESTDEARLHASVLVAPRKPSRALRGLVERTRPLVTIARDANRGGPVARALADAGSAPLELASLGAVEVELAPEISARTLR